MKIIYSLKDRKPFVQVLEEITGVKSVYKKPPTFAYAVDCFTITRDGDLEFDDKADPEVMKNVLMELEKRGFTAKENPYLDKQELAPRDMGLSDGGQPEGGSSGHGNLQTMPQPTPKTLPENEDMGLTVTMPRTYFKEGTLENLKNLLASKQNLIKKALGISELPIVESEEKVSFPWFEVKPADNDSVTAYTHFIYALCEMARNQKRITATEREVENDKYAFRCFLLRLGFIGDVYKKDRKILLKNLIGSAAFKNNKDKGDEHEVSEQTDGRED